MYTFHFRTCASRHNGEHFFDIATSKSGPRPDVFCTLFYFQMCFAPQRRALFQHLNFQKWSETDVFCTLFTSKCASRHNGVQFFISHLASWLRTRRFSEPTFRPSGATKHVGKHSVSRLSYLFAHLHLLSFDFLRGSENFSISYLLPSDFLARPASLSLLTTSLSDLLHFLSSPF